MLEKIKANKKIMLIMSIMVMTLCMSAVFASDSTPAPADYSGLINQLNSGLGANTFVTVIGDVLPYIITVTVIALVWYLIKRAIKKFSKGKPGV